MHIAYLTPEYPHNELNRSGGLGTSIRNLASSLVNNGHQVTVFIVGQNKTMTFFDNGIYIRVIKKKKYLAFNWYLERKRIERVIQNQIAKEGIQLIEAPDWTGISAYLKFSIPLVIRLHGTDGYFCYLENRKQKWKNRFLERKALKSADSIVGVSKYVGTLTNQIFKIKRKIVTVHNGINTEIFKPVETDLNEEQILYFGTIVRKKGVLQLAKAFNLVVEALPKASLVFVGKDNIDVLENRSTMELVNDLLTKKAIKNTTFTLEVPYKQIVNYIAQTQVVVLPSFAEAFPMTWLETLAMEKPLVSSNIGWAEELMVDEETGYTVNPDNHELMADRIINLLKDENTRTLFGKNGRKHVLKYFTVEKIAMQNEKLYKSIINK